MSEFLVQWNVRRLEMIVSAIMHKTNSRFKKDYAEKFSKATGIEIQSQHWSGNRKLSMEGIVV